MTSAAENFRVNLRRLRTSRQAREGNWSQEHVAHRVGMHRNYIGMLERGSRTPSLQTLQRLAECFDVKPHQLLLPPEQLRNR